MGGAVMLPLPLALAVQQYRGTFLANRKAAFAAAILLFIVGGFALLTFATTFGQLLLGKMQIPWLSLLLPTLFVGVGACWAGRLNLRWARRPPGQMVPNSLGVAGSRLSIREGVVGAITIVGVTGLAWCFIESAPPRCAKNVAREDVPFNLPADATEISYCQGFRGTVAYEFTTSECAFVEWVEGGIGSLESEAAGIPLQSITSSFTIQRYGMLAPELGGPEYGIIADGLYYEWSVEDRGVYAAFDRTANRAYYFAHFH